MDSHHFVCDIMSINIRTHARNLIFAILDAPASSFQSRSLMFAIFDIGLYVYTYRSRRF